MPLQLFTAVIAILLLAAVVVGEAQQTGKSETIGVLGGTSREWQQASLEVLRRRLRELGWKEQKNLAIEERFADGDVARLPALSEELVQRKVEIIVAATSAATRAAMRATKIIPIVMVGRPRDVDYAHMVSGYLWLDFTGQVPQPLGQADARASRSPESVRGCLGNHATRRKRRM